WRSRRDPDARRWPGSAPLRSTSEGGNGGRGRGDGGPGRSLRRRKASRFPRSRREASAPGTRFRPLGQQVAAFQHERSRARGNSENTSKTGTFPDSQALPSLEGGGSPGTTLSDGSSSSEEDASSAGREP